MLDRIACLVAPAASGLDRDRQVGGPDDRANDPLHQVEIPKAARSAVPLHDLLHRAPEVDVDELGPVMLGDEPGGFGHRVRVRRRRSGCRSGARPLRTRRPPGCSGSGGGWPRRKETPTARHPPPAPADLAKRGLGHPGHRSQDEREGMRGGIWQLHGKKILGGVGRGNVAGVAGFPGSRGRGCGDAAAAARRRRSLRSLQCAAHGRNRAET